MANDVSPDLDAGLPGSNATQWDVQTDPEHLRVIAGESTSLGVQLGGSSRSEPTTLSFEMLPDYVAAPPVVVPAGESSSHMTLSAGRLAPEGTSEVVLLARTGEKVLRRSVSLKVRAPVSSLDFSFGEGGIVKEAAGPAFRGEPYLLRSLGGGQVLMAGIAFTEGNFGLFVLLVEPDGKRAQSFAGGGPRVLWGTMPVNASVDLSRSERFLFFTQGPDVLSLSLHRVSRDGTVQSSGPFPGESGGYPVRGSLVVLADGTLLAATNDAPALNFLKALPDGSPDSSWGANGRRALSLRGATYIWANSVERLATGESIVVGYATFPAPAPARRSFIVRLTPDGALDPSFGEDGAVLLPSADYNLSEVKTLPDGRIMVGGGTVGGDPLIMRLLRDGTDDPTFRLGRSNPLKTGLKEVGFNCLSLQPDGRVLISGGYRTANEAAVGYLLRLLPDGALDKKFGTDGIVSLSIGTDTWLGGLVVEGETVTVTGAASYDGSKYFPILARYFL